MDQTPMHDHHNPDLLRAIPPAVSRVMEVGCSSGALAREFKKLSRDVHWVGVDIDPACAEMAARHCDETLTMDLEACDEAFYSDYSDRDCWVFGDSLEHLKDPWSVLRRIRRVIPPTGSIVACIPNAQHWSLIVKLAVGEFRYERSGLLDKTHLRWFTRKTMIELFESTGFTVQSTSPRLFDEPPRDAFIPLIAEIVKRCQTQEPVYLNDLKALQFLLRAIPAGSA